MNFRAGGGPFVGATSLTYNDGGWHHVVVTYDGTAVSAHYAQGAAHR